MKNKYAWLPLVVFIVSASFIGCLETESSDRPDFVLNPSALTLTPGSTGTITIGGGLYPYHISSYDVSVAKATVTGSILKITGVSVGSTSITVYDNDEYSGTVSIIVTTGNAELDKVNTAIKETKSNWNAAQNLISTLSEVERKKRLGAVMPESNQISTRSVIESAEFELFEVNQLPASFDWRNASGNYITPVKYQNSCRSSWAFAAVAALESKLLIASDQFKGDIDLSEQIMVSCSNAGNCADGGSVEGASEFLKIKGIGLESCYPYQASNGNCNNSCPEWLSNPSSYQIADWKPVNADITEIKKAIYSNGPVITVFFVYQDFYYYASGVYTYAWGTEQGGHAVLIVGWDDAGQAFIVKNSWSKDWGESGYFRIAYRELAGKTKFGKWTYAYSTDGESHRPKAVDDAYTTLINTTITVAGNQGLLVNDIDINGMALSAIQASAPAHGKVTIYPDGAFTYIPDTDFTGDDRFTYIATNGQLDSNPAAVTIRVTGSVNRRPEAQNSAYTTIVNQVISGNLIAADPDNDALTYVLNNLPVHGTVTINPQTASFVYIPEIHYGGLDQFTFHVNDGKLDSNIAAIAITITLVNHPPVAQDGAYTVSEGQGFNGSLIASDSDGDQLTYIIASSPVKGSVTVTPSTGFFTYTPNTGATGADSFMFRVNDGKADSNSAMISITISTQTIENHAPELNQSQIGNLNAIKEDPDPDTGTVSSPTPNPNPGTRVSDLIKNSITDVDGPSQGIAVTFADITNGVWQFNKGNGWTNFGVLSDASATLLDTDSLIRFVPNDNYNGAISNGITFRAWDQSDAKPKGSTGINTLPAGNKNAFSIQTASASITITPMNDAPVLDNTGNMKLTSIHEAEVNSPGDTVADIIGSGGISRISDVDTDAKKGIAVIAAGNNFGHWQYNTGAGWIDIGHISDTNAILLNSDAKIRFVPNIYWAGESKIEFRAWDQSDNKPNGSTGVDVSQRLGIPNPPRDITPYSSAKEEAVITVITVNDAPLANPDTYSTPKNTPLNISANNGVLFNDPDPDGDALQAILVSTSSHGTLTLNPDGSFVYSPSSDYTGIDTFTYKASDGKLNSDVVTVTITITGQ